MQRFPLAVQNAYSDLLDRLLDEAIIEVGGTPVQRTVRGRRYWYARSYVGSDRFLLKQSHCEESEINPLISVSVMC